MNRLSNKLMNIREGELMVTAGNT